MCILNENTPHLAGIRDYDNIVKCRFYPRTKL